MSDYLWDKTGEADEEVERLEGLLGGLRHRPRAFELPAGAAPAPQAKPAVRRPWRAFAAAAAVVLTLLAGAWLLTLRRGERPAPAQTAAHDPRIVPAPEAPPEATPPRSATAPDAGGEDHGGESDRGGSGGAPPPPKVHAGPGAARRGRRAGPEPGRVGVRRPEAARDGAARAESRRELAAAQTREQREAKEQLMYALRLTSATLGEVQRRTRGEEDAKPAHEERNKTRGTERL